MTADVETVVAGGALLGEAPVWDADAGVLRWVDILRHEIHRFDPRTGRDTAERVGGPVAALAPAAGGGLLAAVGDTVRLLPGDGARQPYGSGHPLARLPTGDRANDGKCDPYGRFLVGTLTERKDPGACALYRLDGPDRVTPVISGVTVSNGLDWSPDGTRLYFADTPTLAVDVLDYDPECGLATGRRPFADLRDAPGRPDGLTVDAEGGVWVALVRGGEVRRYTADGRLDEVVRLPARLVTSCAFGGPELAELYVTSGRFGMTDDEVAREPAAGALFRIRPGVRGRQAHAWRPF
ncbi:SMP-30/gluconolactonase/LRE family protein [Streptomyces armeniacus]|uniref:SMP-30/gluconolactonase/LRE family protein n=1 Tax=Streptomyces armeniacus TaxID=83291 RepID=A0A345XZF9_9ACTN|nr:SMP-30/gluconolactonase/LRE family protein [Streptomyces armeniacus]AXK37025.1 SMP-30/gluconolactonase/LRE family protein [Streptomyces armeniacus]